MKVGISILLINLILLLNPLGHGADTLSLKRQYWLFSHTLEVPLESNLCDLDNGTYQVFNKLFSIKKENEKSCTLNGFYDCASIKLSSEKKEFTCDETQIELSGIPINETSVNRDLAILRFKKNEIDYCKEAYDRGNLATDFILNNNHIHLSGTQSTETYIRECTLTGDLTTSPQLCSSIYFTRLGAVCILGSDSSLVQFKNNVTTTDITEGVLNHYRPIQFDFSMTCHPREIETHWFADPENQLEELIKLDKKGRVREVLAKDNKNYLSHRFDKIGHYYEVMNLKRLLEKPRARQTTWQFYQPSVAANRKRSQTYFWVNYLGNMLDCCSDDRCKSDFQQRAFLKNRLPAQNSTH